MPANSEVASASAEPGGTIGNGTGVFIPQCILDGSALNDPRIMNKPQRKRRGSANQSQSESKHGPTNGKQSQKQQLQKEAPATASSGASTGKNPFAATPKNIRQQQLLCNLVAAADCFSEAAGPPLPPPAGGVSSRAPSLDLSSHQQQHMLAGQPAARGASIDMPCSSSRTSLESSCFYYSRSSMDAGSVRPSVDMSSARPSIDQSCRSSLDCRASMDHCSSYSRPSMESTFSCYAGTPARGSLDMHGNTGGLYSGSTGATGQAVLDAGRRPAIDLGSRPLMPEAAAVGSRPQQRPHSLEIRRRMSLEMAAASAAAAGHAQRVSLDNSDCNDAWSHWAQAKQQQQTSRRVRRDSSSISNYSFGSTYSTSTGALDGRLPSPDMATAAALAAQQAASAAAAAAAGGWDMPSQAALLQLQQQMLLDSKCGLTNGNAMAAAAAAVLLEQQMQQVAHAQQQGLMLRAGCSGSPPAPFRAGADVPVTAALPPAGPSRSGSSNSSPAQMQQAQLNVIQQQLQQIAQANQMAAAAQAVSAAVAAAGQAACMQQQQHLEALHMLQLQDPAALQQLLEQQASEIVGSQSVDQIMLSQHMAAAAAAAEGQSSSLDCAVNAVSLQQQLEMLQMLQL